MFEGTSLFTTTLLAFYAHEENRVSRECASRRPIWEVRRGAIAILFVGLVGADGSLDGPLLRADAVALAEYPERAVVLRVRLVPPPCLEVCVARRLRAVGLRDLRRVELLRRLGARKEAPEDREGDRDRSV